MTNPDFAELKRVLTEFDIVAANQRLIKICEKRQYAGARYSDIAREQFEKDAAIITQLLEIIQSQSEALTDIDSWLKRMSDLKWGDESYAPRFKKSVKNNSNLLSETNTRLQKLRDGGRG